MIELYQKYTAAKDRCKKATLEGHCKVLVLSEEVSDRKSVHEELREVTDAVEEWKQKYEKLEIHELRISMVQEVHKHETELAAPLANKGSPLDELSPRQRSRKLKELKSKAENALSLQRHLA